MLLAIRIQTSKSDHATSGADLGITSTLIPEWLRNSESDSETGCEAHHEGGVRPAGDGTELVNVQKLDAESGAENWDLESSSISGKKSKSAAV